MKVMITKEKWAEIIKNFHNEELHQTIEREVKIPLEKPINRAITIIGPRRSGKTYLMYNSINKLIGKYKKENILYVNFEKAGLLPLNSDDLVVLKEVFFEISPQIKKTDSWFFLDEIQNVDNWELFVRTCLDEGINVFLSGSSSRLLSKDIATSMRGRTLSYLVLPFSFKEYLYYKKIEPEKYLSTKDKAEITNSFEEYLFDGGYPEVVLFKQEMKKTLTNIFETALYRDVIDREKIRNTNSVLMLVKALIASKEFSINKFFNHLKSLNIRVSKNALYHYTNCLEDAFVFFFLRKFDLSYKNASQSLPKVYSVDNGILTINSIDDKGRLLENLVFLELYRRELDIAYFQTPTKNEVDFLIKKGKKVEQLIQVCYDLSNFQTKDREIRSLIQASKEFNSNDLLIITNSQEEELKVEGKKIKIVPAWKWLLEKK
jgi:uncharacterized protein